jgi:methionyl-tRNA formyltransferase
MEPGLDTGPVYARVATPIGRDETAGELSRRLAQLGADLLVASLPALERGELVPEPQAEVGATYAPKLGGPVELSLAEPAECVARAFRAATPEPGAALAIRGERVKVLELRWSDAATELEPGRLIAVAGSALRVSTGGGAVEIGRAQRPGGRPIDGRDLANGLRLSPGDRLA